MESEKELKQEVAGGLTSLFAKEEEDKSDWPRQGVIQMTDVTGKQVKKLESGGLSTWTIPIRISGVEKNKSRYGETVDMKIDLLGDPRIHCGEELYRLPEYISADIREYLKYLYGRQNARGPFLATADVDDLCSLVCGKQREMVLLPLIETVGKIHKIHYSLGVKIFNGKVIEMPIPLNAIKLG